jgi:alanyl-tRNA synthetase
LFGEKYDDCVRTILVRDEEKDGNGPISFELCGGTHVTNTSQIGVFKILADTGIGSGIRRIEAISGPKVLQHLSSLEAVLNSLASKLKCSPQEVPQRVGDLMTELKSCNRELADGKQRNALGNLRRTAKSGLEVITVIVEDFQTEQMRSLNDVIKAQNPSSTISVLASRESRSDKVYAIVNVSADLQSKYNAGRLIATGLAVIGGKGGGTATSAQGGGIGKEKIPVILEKILEAIE